MKQRSCRRKTNTDSQVALAIHRNFTKILTMPPVLNNFEASPHETFANRRLYCVSCHFNECLLKKMTCFIVECVLIANICITMFRRL